MLSRKTLVVTAPREGLLVSVMACGLALDVSATRSRCDKDGTAAGLAGRYEMRPKPN